MADEYLYLHLILKGLFVKLTKPKAKAVVNICRNYLIEEAANQDIKITQKMITSYLVLNPVESLTDVFYCLIGTLQNTNMMPNVIKFYSDLNVKFLFGFNHVKVFEKYGSSVFKLKAAVREYNPNMNINGALWSRWLEGVLDSARWMLQFKNFNAFKKWIKGFHNKGFIGISVLASSLSDGRIKGLGPALSYNFIKDLGLQISKDSAKPDTHTYATGKRCIATV
jgi:hypothetical protein